MTKNFSKRASAICTGSTEVTEGCHMRFAEYAIHILTLLQEYKSIGKGKTNTGSHRFATLCAVVLPLLSLRNSNADSERVFSVVKKIDTDSRSDLGQDTIYAWLSCKLNTEDSCFHFQPSDELLKSAKLATWQYVKDHPSHE